MKKGYTIKGFTIPGNSERYIQLGNSGRPVITSRTGYRADRVILFGNELDAYKFLLRFITDRKRADIDWYVIPYNTWKIDAVGVGMLTDTMNNIANARIGEYWIDNQGVYHNKFYKIRYASLNGYKVPFYSRNSTIKERED